MSQTIKHTDTGYVRCPKLERYIYPNICVSICKYFSAIALNGNGIVCNYDPCSECPHHKLPGGRINDKKM